MRSSSFQNTLAAIAVSAASLFSGSKAYADTFTTYRVSQSSGSIANIGLTTSGSLTTYYNGPGYYSTFTPGTGSTTAASLPPLTFDNGSSCSVSYGGLSRVSMARCNGQYSLFTAFNSTDYFSSLYLLSGGVLRQLYYGGVSGLLLNSMGDVAFTGLYLSDSSTNFLYYNQTSRTPTTVTPEPSSALLLISGCCVAGLFMYRRTLMLTQ